MAQRQPEKHGEYDHKLLEVRRTARVVAGGRRFSFRVAVIVGNHRQRVGLGIGKGPDVQTAVAQAIERGTKSVITVPLRKETITYAASAKYAAAKIMIRPASVGKGVIAGGAMRSVLSLAGIPNITGKVLSRTTNKINVARATLKALTQLTS
ncbi:MAG: 30S ribosomal protein S5 [bacterium]|nr:30S ribosomal protein S5 [bacterium]MDZ4295982.1 30S ribosomal protein S5 [Patescibacteria group bacterium]